MAGHSQFKNIMHRKGRQDAARSKLFGKLEVRRQLSSGLLWAMAGAATAVAATPMPAPFRKLRRSIRSSQVDYICWDPTGILVIESDFKGRPASCREDSR